MHDKKEAILNVIRRALSLGFPNVFGIRRVVDDSIRVLNTHTQFIVLQFLEVRSQGELNWVLSFGSHKAEIRAWQGCVPYWRLWGKNLLPSSSRLLTKSSSLWLQD